MLATDDEYTWDDAFPAEVRRVRLLTFADVAAGKRRKKKPKAKKRRRRKRKRPDRIAA